MRETALAVKAVKPDVAISAATITYGEGPADEAGFLNTRPYTEVLQDWPEWVRAGYLDGPAADREAALIASLA